MPILKIITIKDKIINLLFIVLNIQPLLTKNYMFLV
jgi:hypothetical protein